MPVRLRNVLLARFNASPTASCHPFGEDPMIVVTRATAITHLLSRSCGLGGRNGGPRVTAGPRMVKDAGRRCGAPVKTRTPCRRGPHSRAPRYSALHVATFCLQRL